MGWLALWGVQQISGFAFKPVLEFLADQLGDLAQEAGKDFVKDFFKDSLKSGVERFKQKELAKAMGQAYTQFLFLVQQELEAEEVSKQEIEAYNQPLIKFIGEKSVKQYLGKAFEPGCQSLDLTELSPQWNKLGLKAFPDDFDWKRISRLYLKRVENIIGESQDLKDLFTAKKTGEIDENTKQIAGIIPDYDLQRYRESIQETYRHLKLGKLDSTYRHKSYEVKLWKIFIPQTVRKGLPSSLDKYPKETQEKLQEQGLLVLEQTQQTKSSRSVLEVIADPDYSYLVFVGDPGSGKSTLLQYLALDWAENPTEMLPLLIELREYAKDENRPRDFLAFFHEGKRKICELNQIKLDEQLKSGKALVMFDGLDEIFNNDLRGRVIREIHAFSNKYPQTKIIVTSRRIGYDPEDLEKAEFQHFNLEDFDNSQIREFNKRWHSLALPDESLQDRQETQKRLQSAINDSPAIRQLAGNPLLLTMMAILNRYKELPRRRIDLYEESTNVLLYQWEIEYKKMDLTLDDVDLRAKQGMLRQIAYRMQASEKGLGGNIIHRDDLEEEIADYYFNRLRGNKSGTIAGKIIEQLQKRDFILCQLGKDYYGFVHRTFLEYFCAMAFVERFNKRGKEGGLEIEELKQQVFGQHWQDKNWHEVLRLIAGNLKEFVGDVIDYLIDIYTETKEINALVLAAECLAEVDLEVDLKGVSDRLLDSLKLALEISENTKIIAKTITKYWQKNAEVMIWLENVAIKHNNSEIKTNIAQGIAEIKLSHLSNISVIINIENIGDVYYEQNQYEKAISVYLSQSDLPLISKFGFGESYFELKRFDEAISCYQQWIAKEPKIQFFYNQLGRAFRESGRYLEAVETLNNRIEEIGKEYNIYSIFNWQELGATYQDLGKYQEAISAYQTGINVDPKGQFDYSNYKQLGMVYDYLGEEDVAIENYHQAIKLDPKYSIAYNNLGCLYRSREQWEDAINAFNTAIELNPLSSGTYRHLGLLYLLQNNLIEAEQVLLTAIKINSYDGKAILSFGIFKALQGNLEEAKTNWQAGLKLYPEYAQPARLYRTLYMIALGEIASGLTTLQQILNQEKPPVGLLRYVMEIAHLLQRCPQLTGINEAVNMIEKAISTHPSS
jgi:tetratricopeptide (TPR) repeat protein